MSESRFAKLPKPPYFAVIFSSQRESVGDDDYDAMSERMLELAVKQPGYLGMESARDVERFGVTVSYWDSLKAIKQWRAHSEHLVAQEFGKSQWYKDYEVRVSEVKYAHGKPQE
ncbi:Hypothetical protein PP7435_CHR1-1050 [Komagataella phaffii CBS 7435]|uniref:ABM domain-containing protein n=2 Tax=Komagataella phaffii TaxID=460519 RepID=C4QXY1_KOMPG|nr:Hypothetical protein PAS_chr1-4_0270 [Komagataella phaffii GS115]AOA61467.1 GQ67_01907T0 [Komagataella phaffii]CAH2446923.1 Hypothetical protein BQ9382_C1-5530 [Komagataella phaffii CBS 7435]AOA66166.1 GQ68_01922T0 [Komagataella phaffii GS115]CAY68104.1 Hypothetical protein PAS_chr1-4_0270 [Komagataella phaffii GS115]CCA37180.1 Hypothetical protein PP7435_CHR1-1050 [Komagataella phaffii CBS 7435]